MRWAGAKIAQASTRHAVEAGDEFGNSHFGRDIHAQTDVIVIAIHPRQTMPQNRGTRSPRCRAHRLRMALVKTLRRYCVTKAEQTCRTDSKICGASMIAASGDRSSLSTFDLATQGHRLYSTSQQAAQVAEIAATCRFVVQSCAKPRTRRVAGGTFLQADISHELAKRTAEADGGSSASCLAAWRDLDHAQAIVFQRRAPSHLTEAVRQRQIAFRRSLAVQSARRDHPLC